jgi:hypothetical protein
VSSTRGEAIVAVTIEKVLDGISAFGGDQRRTPTDRTGTFA